MTRCVTHAHPPPPPMNFDAYISITPGIRNGKLCLKGTRITVYDVLDYLADGLTEADH